MDNSLNGIAGRRTVLDDSTYADARDDFDRFHSYWQGSHQSTRRWLRRFRHYYNRHLPNQALVNLVCRS